MEEMARATYDGQMVQADSAEARGDHLAAAQTFSEAAMQDVEPERAGQAWQRAGTNYRLAGRYYESSGCFARARVAYIGIVSQQCRLYRNLELDRDRGALILDQGDPAGAATILETACTKQRAAGYALEAAATQGFLGRAYLLSGRKVEARAACLRAHAVLHGKHDVWELNNLIWLLKCVRCYERLPIVARAVRLATRTGYRRRAVEALILLIGGNRLYEAVRALA